MPKSQLRSALSSLLAVSLALVAPQAAWSEIGTEAAAAAKPRLIVLTDIGAEPDDMESMVRLLTYANELDIEGLIATTSVHLHHETGRHLIEERVRAYGEVVGNLRVHDPAYPSAEALMAKVRATPAVYGMAGVGKGKDNEASRLIIAAVDSPDPRPVWVSVWGGTQPLAQALWSVRATRSRAAVERFVAKLRVYSISDQDDAGPWARATFPKLFWIASIHGFTQYDLATWPGISAPTPGADAAVVSKAWLDANIRSKGPLGAVYPRPMFIMEGDTPSFLYLARNGLGSSEHPDWGSWGGRWGRISADLGQWADVSETAPGTDGQPVSGNKVSIWRWRQAFQNDFAARMAWSVSPRFADANHAPQPVLNGSQGLAPVELRVCAGNSVALSAAGSSDPDGNRLTYRWWGYREAAGIWSPPLHLTVPDGQEGQEAQAVVPVWTQPASQSMPDVLRHHVILEVTDSGSPALVRYRRAIIAVPTRGGLDAAGKPCAPIVVAKPVPLARSTKDTSIAVPGRYSTADSEIGLLLDNPATRAIVERHLPEIATLAASSPLARNLTLRALHEFDARITEAALAAIDAQLAALPLK